MIKKKYNLKENEKKKNNKKLIMDELEINPRITLTQLSKKRRIPITTISDYLKQISNKYDFVGRWYKKVEDENENEL